MKPFLDKRISSLKTIEIEGNNGIIGEINTK